MNKNLLLSFVALCCLVLLVNARPDPQNLSDVTDEEKAEINKPIEVGDDSQPTQEDIEEDSKLEEQLEEMIEDDEDDDYYDDDYNGWTDQIMNPIRNVGQSISNSVNGAAAIVNNGADMANNWWNGSGDEDYDDYFENYDDANEQVNAWWDAHIEEEYEYDEDDDMEKMVDNDGGDDDANRNILDEDDEDYDDYEEDLYDYYDLYSNMRYPKPEESKWEASQIHHPKDNRVQLNRMRSRQSVPYSVDDYFDFVVIAMCVVLLFIMLMAGISRYQNQRYLKKTYGKRNSKDGEKRPLID